MKSARVQLFGLTGKYATVDLDANQGATVGKDLKWPDGSVVMEADIRSGGAVTSPSSSVTDEIDEGRYNLYFTTKRAQDAVGNILADTDTIDFTYDGTAHVIKADLKDLANTLGGTLVAVTRDAKGRISATKPVTPGDGIDITDNGTSWVITLTGLPIYLIDEAGNQLTDESGNPLVDSVTTGLPVSFIDITDKPTTRDGYGITDVPLKTDAAYFPPYATSGAPSAASNQYKAITITDLAEGPRPCWSDGTNWRRFSDNTVAA